MNSAVLVAGPIRMGHRGSVALAAGGAILLSAKVVCVKLLYQYGLDAVDVITLRMLTAGPLFLVVAVCGRCNGCRWPSPTPGSR